MKRKFSKNSSYKIIRLTNNENIPLTFNTYYEWEKRNYDIINLPDDTELIDILFENDKYVDAIVVQYEGLQPSLPILNELPDYYKRLVHYIMADDNYGISLALEINNNQLSKNFQPLFSIVTPLYKTKFTSFCAAYNSLTLQDNNDWEWILIDDSPEEESKIKEFIEARKDLRLRYFRIGPTNGNIGLSKWRGNCMSTGKWLVEFDHDDMLAPWCLHTLKEAIEKYPDNKFIYSDSTPVDKNGNAKPCEWDDYDFGMGYGYSYETKMPDGNLIRTDSSGPVNCATIRHIVGVGNHVRCWERMFYFAIGGHNVTQRIADDYELIVRSFLYTRFTHIPICCYLQRFDGNNSQFVEEPDTDDQGNINDIQRRVRLISIYYDKAIHDRLEQLGLNDDYWIEGDPYETAQTYKQLHRDECAEDIYVPEWSK